MNTKSLFASKTFWFNLLGIVAAVSTTYAAIIPPKALPYVMAAGGVANIILRTVTNQGVSVLPVAK